MNHREKVSSEETELAALLPSPEDVERYRQTGYYISKKLYSTDELDSAIAASERYYAGLTEREIALPNNRTYPLAWYPGDGIDCLRKNDFSTLVAPELDALLRKRILGLIAALLCGDDVRLWHDQLLYKPPSNDDAPQSVGWHTDYGYWRTCSSDSMLTAWGLYRHGRIHWYNNVRGRQYALAGKQPFELFLFRPERPREAV